MCEKVHRFLSKFADKDTAGCADAVEENHGNFDDCYYAGYDDGEIGLAKEILKLLDKK